MVFAKTWRRLPTPLAAVWLIVIIAVPIIGPVAWLSFERIALRS